MPYVICDKCGKRRRWVTSKVRYLRDYRTPCCDTTAHRVPKKVVTAHRAPKKPSAPSIFTNYLLGARIEGTNDWLSERGKISLVSSRKIRLKSAGQQTLYLVPTATVREGYRFFECSGNCGMAEVDCRALHKARIYEEDWQRLLAL